MDMNALRHRFNNFILPFVRGKDRVCACTCGRYQDYRVIPYNEAQTTGASTEDHFSSDVMTQQEKNLIIGLLLGLCIIWFLLWLDKVWLLWLKYWRENRMSDVGFWPRMPKFSNTRDLFRQLFPQHTEDSRGNMVHIKQDVDHNVNGNI